MRRWIWFSETLAAEDGARFRYCGLIQKTFSATISRVTGWLGRLRDSPTLSASDLGRLSCRRMQASPPGLRWSRPPNTG